MNFDLNKKQKEAVEYKGGPLLIVAGAGSGKTRTLTSRLAYLLMQGIKPENIIAITFTNKAAEEMRNRIFNQQPTPSSSPPWADATGQATNNQQLFIGTFHSLGARILRKEAKLLKRTSSFTIFDDDDSKSLIKKIVKDFNLNEKEKRKYAVPFLTKEFSRIKNELINHEEIGDEFLKELFKEYEQRLQRNNAFAFDDLLEKVVRIFVKHPEVLKKYQEQFKYILVDEYQDTNASQYEFIKLLAQKHRNLSVVGDDQQCIPPGSKVVTLDGKRNIEDLVLKDKIIAAVGNGKSLLMHIGKIKKFRYKGPLIKIITKSGKSLRLTPNHLVFSRIQLLADIFYVYLMYRKDKGFRIGITKGSRVGARGELQLGLIVRNNQEKADKIWTLRICVSRNEAEYHEFFYAFKYGIPTVVFDTNNRKMKLTQRHIDLLYKEIDTKKRGIELMKKELLYFEYPHWIPQGTVRHSARRLRLRLALFDDRRHSLINPWGMSRLSVNTKDLRLKKEIEKLGFRVRKGKLRDWRFEITSKNYDKLESISDRFRRINSEIEIVKSACLTKNKRLFFQPASHIRPTMIIATRNKKGEIVEDIVKETTIENYDGLVYDLDVANVHNYIANDLVVHNSIFGFRGSDFRNFLNFDKDWKEAKVVLLEENYRSTVNIINAASIVISNNKFQKHKNLWTKNPQGELVKIIEHNDADNEAEWIAEQILNFKSQCRDFVQDECAVAGN